VNKENKNDKNTALHIAAGNVNVSLKFIEKLKLADARLQNWNQDTPFHVAAKSVNPNTIIYLLNTFAPIKFGWNIDDAECNRDQDKKTLLSICACSGNAEAVALLIQHGADLSTDILRDIVSKSVECPERTEQLLAVYRVIVENAVTWRCMKANIMLITKGSSEYDECLRETMMWLITRPDKPQWNVVRCAIETGASGILEEILNTQNVFRFDVIENNETSYDVTHFIHIVPEKSGNITEANYDQRALTNKPFSVPYIRQLIDNSSKWRDARIFQKEPIKKLTQPYIRFTQLLYFAFALLQSIYMICFSYYCIPTTCSLIELFNLNVSASRCEFKADNMSTYVHVFPSSVLWLWFIWPSILSCLSAVLLLVVIGGLVFVIISFAKNVHRYFTCKDYVKYDGKKYFMYLGLFTALAFCISAWVWCNRYSDKTNYYSYVKATSMVLLFGWILDFFFLSEMVKKFCIFSHVLREIIFKDIVMSFLLVFLFTFVGFSFAMHTLRMSELPSDDVVYLGGTAYNVFLAALGTGDYFQDARDERSRAGLHFDLFDVVVIAYLCVTAIILLNVLIAMINHRYDKAMLRAENDWRCWMLDVALHVLIICKNCTKEPRVDPNNPQFCCCSCGQRCCFCRDGRRQLHSVTTLRIPPNRLILTVERP